MSRFVLVVLGFAVRGVIAAVGLGGGVRGASGRKNVTFIHPGSSLFLFLSRSPGSLGNLVGG